MSSVVVDIVVLALVLSSQIRAKPLRGFKLPAILLVIGVSEVGAFLAGDGQPATKILMGQEPIHAIQHGPAVVALAGSIAIAAVFAAVRVPSIRLWWQDGRCWRKGNLLTAALWVAALAAHLLYDGIMSGDATIGGLGDASAVLYVGVGLAVQYGMLTARSARMPRGDPRSDATRPASR